jgi:hypothetical protein
MSPFDTIEKAERRMGTAPVRPGVSGGEPPASWLNIYHKTGRIGNSGGPVGFTNMSEQQRIACEQIIRNHLRTAFLLPDDRIDALLPRFLASLRELWSKLEHAAATGSREETGRAGHALKGALLSLGLTAPADKALAVEQACRAEGGADDYFPLIAELKEEMAGII